jgi:hypothetical protein
VKDVWGATDVVPANAASNFSTALVVLGLLFLVAGIWNHSLLIHIP